MRFPSAFAAALFALFALVPFGCAGSDGGTCTDYCQSRARCCAGTASCSSDKADIPTCVATCEDLSKDAAYAEALSAQAGCMKSSTCQEIEQGDCLPKP
jgi:hypothetical protein